MTDKILKVEINFPVPVDFPDELFKEIMDAAGEACVLYQDTHPGRIMWPAGIGYKITHMPMTQEDEQTRGIEFADDTLCIDCFERADYQAKCAKCGMEQGDHKDHIIDPPAGNCEFTISNA